MKEDKRKLELMLRAFLHGIIDIEFAIDFILKVYSNSRRFNYNSFIIGWTLGLFVATILFRYILK